MDTMHPDLADVIVTEVDARFLGLVSALNARDAAAWADYYSETAFVSAIAGTDYFGSKAAWVETVAAYFSDRTSQRVQPEEVRITPLSASSALLTSQEQTAFELDNGASFSGRHVFTMLWGKEGGQWRILHSHESWLDE
jgi:ketosteroid isomerase-like protein